ncbi:hypothetical protein [Olleya sp. Hel_I_94]|uniref:hypothetical protein n=1 Tax=Olleya sp. Hel_I_94 TaxID=1250001 RepID=UPI0011A63049|nr:hypothetical protein [Olleya sp. Hel_I_94]TVZ49860.1 hypothetical protein JM82_0299 [Olleya sp. Hel_I_94]
MKTVFQILILIFTTVSCQTQEIDVNYENIEINIPGKPGPWIKYDGNYYCYFETDNDKFSSGSKHQFYILDRNGKIDKRIDVPKVLQTFYYDLYIKNDTIFTTEYYDHNTFYLDQNKNSWVKTKKGIDLYYEDNNYSVYSLEFGEWGGVTWFKDKVTNKQYEVGATTPIVNKLNNAYYLTSGKSILKIIDPKKLDKSKEPYDYKKAVIDERYHREGSNSINGAEIIYEYKNDDYFNPKFSLATSFAANNKLYHLYKDSISTNIGVVKNDSLIPIYTFKSKIRPFKWYYDSRNPIQNNDYQTVQFQTDSENNYGIIEINGKSFNVINFKNTYREPVFGKVELTEWFENTFDFYYSNFNNLHLDKIDKIEQNLNATDLTQSHKISHFLLDGKDVETPRIYRKIESSELSLVTMYYYSRKDKTIELIEFEWEKNKNNNFEDIINSTSEESKIETLYESKFDWISNYLQNKIGKPTSSISEKSSVEQKWIIDNLTIGLKYNKRKLELRMYKK